MGVTMAKSTKPDPLKHFTVEETAQMLGVSPKTINREIADGHLIPTEIRSAVRISYAEIQRFAATPKRKIRKKLPKKDKA